jgi:hypothetical protein
VLVEFGRALLEDEGPEVRELGCDGGAFGVEGFRESVGFADCN